MGWQQCCGYISLITHFNPEDGGSTVSETLVSKHHTTERNNPEDRELYIQCRENLESQLIVCLMLNFYILLLFGLGDWTFP
jgi:hypothetical protein